MHTPPNTPIVSLVPDEARLDFLPELFPNCYLRGERLVFAITRQWFPSYGGGHWDFFKVDDKPAFMAPHGAGALEAAIAGNGFSGVLSHQAVGVIATLVALSACLEQIGSEALFERYDRLRNLIAHLPERDLIYRAID